LLDGVDALTAAGVDVSGRLLLVGGGAHSAAYRQVLADLSGRAVEVPDVTEAVARGAAVQAAAVLHGRDPATVARVWAPGGAATEVPSAGVEAAAIRERYHTVAMEPDTQ
jgi:xylulokinase